MHVVLKALMNVDLLSWFLLGFLNALNFSKAIVLNLKRENSINNIAAHLP
jgi:hypothetical protein